MNAVMVGIFIASSVMLNGKVHADEWASTPEVIAAANVSNPLFERTQAEPSVEKMDFQNFPEFVGGFIFMDGSLVGSKVVGAGADAPDKLACYSESIAERRSSNATSSSGSMVPAATYRIHFHDGSLGCQISVDASGKINPLDGASAGFHAISEHLTVLSCSLSTQIRDTADPGPGTVHGCICHMGPCVPNGHCGTVCDCWN